MNYEDERFKKVEQEKQDQLAQVNQTYQDLLNERNALTTEQSNLVDQWQTTQNENLDKQLAYQQDLINQQRKDTEKAYQKEAKSAYADYQKEKDAYGVEREKQVSSGLGNTGYSESSRVNMYNTYQNRLASAKESMDTAYMQFDNAIREAQLQNDVTKAENALSALQQKLNITLEAFDYTSTAKTNLLGQQQNINNTYYNRYQDVVNQINYEKEREEAIRQFNEQMAYQRQRDAIKDAQWEREYALSQANNYYGGGSNNDGVLYYDYNTPSETQTAEKVLQPSSYQSIELHNSSASQWFSEKIGTGNTTMSKLAQIVTEGINNGKLSQSDKMKIYSHYGVGVSK